MRYAGRLTDWNHAKGYGFVVPHDGGAFVHIRAFERRGGGRRSATLSPMRYRATRAAGATRCRCASPVHCRHPGRWHATDVPPGYAFR